MPEGKDRFDAFMRMAEFRFERFKTRQQFEFRMSFSLWALMAAALIYVDVRPQETGLIIALVAIFVIHALLLGQIWVRNENDQATAFFYVSSAENVLSSASVTKKPAPIQTFSAFQLWFGFLRSLHLNWGATFQMLVTAGMAVIVYWLLGQIDRSATP